jgi:cytochrome c2
VLLLATGLALLGVAVAAFVREASPEWERVRDDVRRRVAAKVGDDRAARLVPEGLAQVWIPELSRVDRCVACHPVTEGGPDLAGLPVPAGSHPFPALLAAHPVERFGCTLCHGGQGAATTQAAAHGDVAHWDDPLLSTARARRYGLTAAELMETKCNVCHRADARVEGMPRVDEAKALLDAKRCRSCHAIEGRGGTTGPDLSKVADAPPEHLAFPSPWTRARSALAWHVAHFLDPQAMSPGSEMKVPGGLTEREAVGLALLVRSWSSWVPPPGWLPKAKR